MSNLTRDERRAQGRSLRAQTPRRSHGCWRPAANRPDPIDLLQQQDEGRLAHLLPIKYGRMVESPFAFLRGSAVVMAADLAGTPVTGIETILCGDAYLSNFGVFATPERTLVFDINDFDEVYPGPWEWDLKRLAASAAVAGRANGFRDSVNRKLAENVASSYRGAMRYFTEHTTLEMWYYRVEAEQVLDLFEEKSSKQGRKSAEKMVSKARKRTQAQTLEKLTVFEDGRRSIVSDPPLLVPFRQDLLTRIVGEERASLMTRAAVEKSWSQYLDNLSSERRFLLQRYRISDVALRVGGVGSVGTRCIIVLLEGLSEDDAIILQLKEAGPSALEKHLEKRPYTRHAERVVTGQRLVQAASDIFLGWHKSTLSGVDYYWRQLKDMKGSVEVDELDETGLETYLALCGWSLARAHARTGDAAQTAGHLGQSDSFAKSIGKFALAYADQTEQDHEALEKAIKSGRIRAETGI